MTLQQQKLVNEALAHYHISASAIEFIRHNENLTCRVRDGEKAMCCAYGVRWKGFS